MPSLTDFVAAAVAAELERRRPMIDGAGTDTLRALRVDVRFFAKSGRPRSVSVALETERTFD